MIIILEKYIKRGEAVSGIGNGWDISFQKRTLSEINKMFFFDFWYFMNATIGFKVEIEANHPIAEGREVKDPGREGN